MKRFLLAALAACLPLGLSLGVVAPVTAAAPDAKAQPSAADPATHPLGDLAATPPMGWNSWNSFHCDVSAKLVEETADAMVASGMRDAGYEYVNIDDCWSTRTRSADGKLVPDPVKFPDGIKAVADYVHSKGLKLGIYSSAGDTTCAGYPAALFHEESDAQQWADWGVDLLKYDNCGDHAGLTQQQRYQRMHDALAGVDRDIVFSLCDWGSGQDWLWNGEAQVGHYWRNTGDISASWASVLSILDQQTEMHNYTGPNNWADPDMLEVGVAPLTYTESRAHMALWAVLNAPLISGNDLRTMSPSVRKLLTNETVIGVDQDWGGSSGQRLARDGDKDIWYKPMSDGSVAVVLLNRGDQAQTISATGSALGLRDRDLVVHDVWSGSDSGAHSTVRARVAPHDAAFFLVSNGGTRGLEPLTTVETDAPAYVERSETMSVTVRLFNDGTTQVRKARLSLDVPRGWTATSRTWTELTKVKPGETGELEVHLQADDPDLGAAQIGSTASWQTDNGLHSAVDRTSFSVVTKPAAGDNPVSGLTFLDSQNYWGPVERNTSNGEAKAGDGKPITLGGVTYDSGLGVHAPSRVDLFAGAACDTFTADVGIDDEVGDQGEVEFVVLADGDEVARVAAAGADAAKPLTADVSDARVVSLVVDQGPSGTNYDHADWAGATLSCS